MRPLSQALTALIKCAEDIVLRPALLAAKPPETFYALCEEIRRYEALPAEGERATRAAMVMMPAIEAFFADTKADHHWQMVVGSLLPPLRKDAYQALQNERESLLADGVRR